MEAAIFDTENNQETLRRRHIDQHFLSQITLEEAYSWGVGEDESGDGLYCGFEGVVRAAVIGV